MFGSRTSSSHLRDSSASAIESILSNTTRLRQINLSYWTKLNYFDSDIEEIPAIIFNATARYDSIKRSFTFSNCLLNLMHDSTIRFIISLYLSHSLSNELKLVYMNDDAISPKYRPILFDRTNA